MKKYTLSEINDMVKSKGLNFGISINWDGSTSFYIETKRSICYWFDVCENGYSLFRHAYHCGSGKTSKSIKSRETGWNLLKKFDCEYVQILDIQTKFVEIVEKSHTWGTGYDVRKLIMTLDNVTPMIEEFTYDEKMEFIDWLGFQHGSMHYYINRELKKHVNKVHANQSEVIEPINEETEEPIKISKEVLSFRHVHTKNPLTNEMVHEAVKMGFDFSSFIGTQTIGELFTHLDDFFRENQDDLRREVHYVVPEEFEDIQTVEFKNYTSSGQIVDFESYSDKPRTQIFHSTFVDYNQERKPILYSLWCWSTSKPKQPI